MNNDDQAQIPLDTEISDDFEVPTEPSENVDILEALFGKDESTEFKYKNRGASISSLMDISNSLPKNPTEEIDIENIVGGVVFFFAGNHKLLDYCYLSERIEELERGNFVNLPEQTLRNGIIRSVGPRLEEAIIQELGTKTDRTIIDKILDNIISACFEEGAIFESKKEVRDWLKEQQDKAWKLALSRGVRIARDIFDEPVEVFYVLNAKKDPGKAQEYLESLGVKFDDEEILKYAYSGFANILKFATFEESNEKDLLDWYYDLFNFDDKAQEFLDYMHEFIKKEDKGRALAKAFEEYITNRSE